MTIGVRRRDDRVVPPNMKTKLVSLLGGLLASLAMACHGQTLEAVYLNSNPSQTVSGSFNGGASYTSYVSGLMNFDKFQAFCVDPDQRIYTNEAVIYTIQNPATLTEEGAISRIVGGYYASAQTSLDAAGAQWAIWEVLKDGSHSPSFSSGLDRLQNPSSSVATRAMDYLNHLSTLPAAPLMYLTSATRQDMITMVPEPAATLLGGLGTLLLFRRRR